MHNGYKEKQLFYKIINGVTKVVSSDFNQVGSLDFSLRSTLTNYENTKESSFIYLENNNTTNFIFEDFTFKESNFVNWLLMDVGDADGDEDIILSSFPYVFIPVPDEQANFWKENSTDLMILENNIN